MKRLATIAALGLFLLLQSGCIAVSAKEMTPGGRYDAVALDGRIYLVDKKNRTAHPVNVVANDTATTP